MPYICLELEAERVATWPLRSGKSRNEAQRRCIDDALWSAAAVAVAEESAKTANG